MGIARRYLGIENSFQEGQISPALFGGFLSQRVELFSHAGQLETVEMALYPAIGQVSHAATSAQASYWCRGRISTRGAWNDPQSEPGRPTVCRAPGRFEAGASLGSFW